MKTELNQWSLMEISAKYVKRPTEKYMVKSSKDAFDYLKNVFNKDDINYVEEFIVLYLNRTNRIIGWKQISKGGTCGTVIDMKVIFTFGLTCGAQAIILSHNHPSGNLKPSVEDINITKRIREAAKILEFNVLDHLIIEPELTSFYSLADEGQL